MRRGGKVNLHEVRVQGPTDINLLAAQFASHHLKVARDGLPLLVVQGPCLLVADPGVDTTTTRVNPEDVIVAKVLPQGRLQDFDGHGREFPALAADVGLVAACSDVVIVCQVDIEAQLLGQGHEGSGSAEHLAVSGVRRVDRPDLDTPRHQADHVFAEPGSLHAVSKRPNSNRLLGVRAG